MAAPDPDGNMTNPSKDNYWRFGSNLSGGSFYKPVRTECHVSGGTYYGGLTMGKDAKLSGKPVNTGTVINDKTNIPNPNSTPVTVTYKYGKLDGIYAKQIVQAGEKAIEPDVPSRQGYQFTDWYLDDTKYDFNTAVTGDMTLTAQWTLDRYTISYNLNNGTATGNPDSYTVESDAITLNTPTRPGYTFTGWSGTGLTGEKNLTVTIEKGSTGNRTYTAHWRYNGGGGSSSSPSYPVSVPDKTDHGSVTVSPKNASKGDTVTVTVKSDSGYVLETISVTDKNGNDLKLTDKGNGKYTFTMPTSKVEIKVTFMEDNSVLNFFYDVPNDAYYYEAVKWAAENGITGGVGNSLFAPNQPCTRAQIVTFLWRAAGSPEPKNMSNFSDVPADSYYAKAVAWAVENGITTGTGDGKFSPDATCTRAQSVTFLFRASKASANGAPAFSDVVATAYYAEAVKWATDNGITNGIGDNLFGSDNDCTRAQIVTFLYRMYQEN